MGFRSASDVAFLQLSDSVFCVQCELISYNNTSNCFACGSQAILNLGRLMGGSLLAQETATVITDEKMRRVVAELLGPGAIGRKPATPVEAPEAPEMPGSAASRSFSGVRYCGGGASRTDSGFGVSGRKWIAGASGFVNANGVGSGDGSDAGIGFGAGADQRWQDAMSRDNGCGRPRTGSAGKPGARTLRDVSSYGESMAMRSSDGRSGS